MTRYSNKYLLSHCVDLYFKCNNRYVHILTDGSLIPEILNDRGRNRVLQSEIALLEPTEIDINAIEVNPVYLHNVCHLSQDMANNKQSVYDALQMFAPAAQLGFYSYYCVATDNENRGDYIWVARPKEGKVNEAILKFEFPEFEALAEQEDSKGNLNRMKI